MPQITDKTFTTLDELGHEKTWTFSSPKESGANGAGEYGGFYRFGEQKCLIKQDSRISLNIAEFFAGMVYQHLVPDVSAKIHLVRVDDAKQISSDGRNVYLVSEFIPGWKSDLYTDVEVSLNRSPERSKYKLLETAQLIRRLIFRSGELASVFKKENANGNYLNFGQVAATSLLINNTDTHVGNLGVIENRDDGHKKLAIVDYGAAFRNMTSKINPHSFKKYISSHTLNREGWNNFLFYPESIKITPDFAFELDRASQTDLEPVVTDAFRQIAEFYGIRPIVEFAVRAGFSLPLEEAALTRLERNPSLAAQKIKLIKEACLDSLQQRQNDLARFSAQIKIDMCIHVERVSKKCSLDGSFVDKNGRNTTFNDVVFDHFNYFKEITLGTEKFKFRKSTHKYQPKLIQDVENQSRVVFACFLLVAENQDIQDKYNIRSVDDAVRALQNGTIDKRALDRALNIDFTSRAKEILLDFKQRGMEANFNTSLRIMADGGITPTPAESERLRRCAKLQDAIIELDSECTKLGLLYDEQQKAALSTYKNMTIVLALQGADIFKRDYGAIEQRAISAIDHNVFTNCARALGNIIFIALVTASVVGLFTMIYTGRTQGLLLFRGPEQELPNISSKFKDIQDDDESPSLHSVP